MNIYELSQKALSNKDLYHLFDNNIKIYKYSDLLQFDTINDAFHPFNIIFILYEIEQNFGHWCVICQDKNTIYFFDPYGLFPDDELVYTDKFMNETFHRSSIPKLSVLLIKSPKRVVYNKYQLQDPSNLDIATCGRWCALYALLYQSINIDEFGKLFLQYKTNPDYIVTLLTNFI